MKTVIDLLVKDLIPLELFGIFVIGILYVRFIYKTAKEKIDIANKERDYYKKINEELTGKIGRLEKVLQEKIKNVISCNENL